MIDCIILAGGLGTRLRTAVPDQPKPLAPIRGKPFLDLLLDRLSFTSKVVLAVGYKASQIIDYYTSCPPSVCLDFSVESTPLGTGGAIQRALSKTSSDQILVLNGDSFLEFIFVPFWEYHLSKKSALTLATVHVEDADRFGQIEIDGGSQKIVSFREKSSCKASGWINAGVYLMKRQLFDNLPLGDSFSLEKEVFPLLLKRDVEIFSYCLETPFIDIGTPASFYEAQSLLSSRVLS